MVNTLIKVFNFALVQNTKYLLAKTKQKKKGKKKWLLIKILKSA